MTSQNGTNRRQPKQSSNPFTLRPHTVFGSHSLGSLFSRSSSDYVNNLENLPEGREVNYPRKNSASSTKTIDVIRHPNRSNTNLHSLQNLLSNNQSQESFVSDISIIEEDTLSKLTGNSSRPTSSSVVKEGYLNKKVDSNQTSVTNTLARGWKLYYVTLRGAKLTFYKPPSESEIRNSIAFSSGSLGGVSPGSSPSNGITKSNSKTKFSGMALIPATFDVQARALLFEQPNPTTNKLLIDNYRYGDTFNEVDARYFKFKRYTCLLIFSDSLMVFKRHWIKSNRASIFGAVNEKLKINTGGGLNEDMDPSKGHFTKWKYHATYRLEDCDVMDASSTVFNNGSSSSQIFNHGNNSASSLATLSPQGDFSAPLASGKVQAFQLFIKDKMKTSRLFVAATSNSKDAWTAKLLELKENVGNNQSNSPHLESNSTDHPSPTLAVDTSEREASVKSNDHSKTRLFWGLGRHPELVVQFTDSIEGTESFNIKSGSVNALIHEAIFSTSSNSSNTDYRKAFIYLYPNFTTSDTLTNELVRYGKNLFKEDQESDERKLEMKNNFAEFVYMWISMNGLTIDKESLKQLRTVVNEHLGQFTDKYNYIAVLDSLADVKETVTPPTSLSTELRKSEPQAAESQTNVSSLMKTGLTPSVFLKMDPNELAQQLYVFHYTMFGQYQLKLNDPCHMLASLTDPTHVFSFTLKHPHFLTKLIFHHLFFATPSSAPSRRAAIINQWIQVGHLSRDLGDMASWIAIASGVCSPAVTRLSETWRSVDKRLIKLINKRWVPVLVDLGLFRPDHPGRPDAPKCMVLIQEQNVKRPTLNFVLPFFGSFRQYMLRLLESSLNDVESKTKPNYIGFESYLSVYRISKSLRGQWPNSLSPEAYNSSICTFAIKRVYFDYFVKASSTSQHSNLGSYVDEMNFDYDIVSLHKRSEICETGFVTDYVHQDPAGSKGNPSIPLSFPRPLRFAPLFLELVAPHIPLSFGTDDYVDPYNPGLSIADSSNYFRKRTQSAPISTYTSITAARDAARKAHSLQSENSLENTLNLSRFNENLTQSIVATKNHNLVFFVKSNTVTKGFDPNVPITEITNFQVFSGPIKELIDVLILGVDQYLNELIDYKEDLILIEDISLVKFNIDEFQEIFLCTYRSLCLPTTLFEMLKEKFNQTLVHVLSKPSRSANLTKDITVQLRILNVLKFWITYHFHDFLDNLELLQLIYVFLYSLGEKMANILDPSVTSLAKELHILCEIRSLTPLASSSTKTSNERMEPVFKSPYGQVPSPSGSVENLASTIQHQVTSWDIDTYSEGQLIDAFHHFAVPMLRNASVKDYLLSCTLLEAQSISTWSWLSSSKPLSYSEDETVVSDIFNLLENCRRKIVMLNSVNSTAPNVTTKTAASNKIVCERVLVSLFPRPIADLWQFREKIRTWTIMQIASDLKLEERVARIIKILKMIVICRRQMQDSAPFHYNCLSEIMHIPEDTLLKIQANHPVPSFVERGLIAGILSPESRCFTRAWTEIATQFNISVDDLSSLLEAVGKKYLDQLPPLETVAPCVGWVFESVATIIKYLPDKVTSSQTYNISKRISVYRLLQTFAAWVGLATASLTNKRGFHTMQLISGLEAFKKPDWVQVRHFAQLENGNGASHYASSIYHYATGSSKKVFHHLVADQLEKQKLENREIERMMREVRAQQLDALKKQQEQAKLLDRQNKELQLRKSKTKELAKMASLFKSVHGSGDSNFSLAQLSSLSSRKPVHVIKLINCTATVDPTYVKRDFVLRIVTEEGGQFLLQCIDHADMLTWCELINQAAQLAAARRLTLLAEDANVQQSEENSTTSIITPKHKNSVFGVELSKVMKDGKPPLIVTKCIEEIEKRGLEEIGIYRVPGSNSKIQALCRKFDEDSESVYLGAEDWQDINVVACTLKQFIRDLPEPVATYELYDAFIQAVGIDDYDERLFAIQDLLPKLPEANYQFLKILIEHLEKVTDFEEVNHMYATNLAIVFGPTLFRPPPSSSSFALSMANLGYQQNLVKNLILQYHWLFDVEAEAEAEVEVENLEVASKDEDSSASKSTSTANQPMLIPELPNISLSPSSGLEGLMESYSSSL